MIKDLEESTHGHRSKDLASEKVGEKENAEKNDSKSKVTSLMKPSPLKPSSKPPSKPASKPITKSVTLLSIPSLFSPESIKQKGLETINELLDLESPKFSKQLFDYLDQEDTLEYFISKITLLPAAQQFYGLVPIQNKERPLIASSNDIMIAYRAMELLCSANYYSKRLFFVLENRLISSLIKMCLPSSQGSF